MRAAVLAGGKARRFGGGLKGLAHVGGERILDRVLHQLRLWDPTPLMVTSTPGADAWAPNTPIVPDSAPGAGSLGGLLTALSTTREATIVVGWDMPFLSTQLIAALVDQLKPNHHASLPQSEGPLGLEPLCAVYDPACIPAIENALAREDKRMTSFHDDVRCVVLPLERVRTFGAPETVFFNVNTPDDLEVANRMAAQHEGPTNDPT